MPIHAELQAFQEKKRGRESFPGYGLVALRGWPRRCRVTCRPSASAVRTCYASSPSGQPRTTLRCNSGNAAVCTALTYLSRRPGKPPQAARGRRSMDPGYRNRQPPHKHKTTPDPFSVPSIEKSERSWLATLTHRFRPKSGLRIALGDLSRPVCNASSLGQPLIVKCPPSIPSSIPNDYRVYD